MRPKWITGVALVVVLIALAATALYIGRGGHENLGNSEYYQTEHDQNENYRPTEKFRDPKTADFSVENLTLPFSTGDLDAEHGEVNPMGVVRFSKDMPEFGHGGIDFPLVQGAEVRAVADGPIVNIKSAGDPWGGQGIYQLLGEPFDYAQGEGWAFLYEHITPAEGLQEGDELEAGDVIATKTPPQGFTAHFQLTYLFNNYEFSRDDQCWPESLSQKASSELTAWWDDYRFGDILQSAWHTTSEEGAWPFRGLLDETKYPNGPQFCYPQGTDLR